MRRSALFSLVLPLAVLALGATAKVSPAAATWFGLAGPICPLGHLLGSDACPGCGLTRGTSLVVQGRFAEALTVNPAGFVIAGLSLAAVLLHLDVLRRGRVLDAHLRLRSLGRWCFLGGVLLAWAARATGCLLPS